MWIQRALNSELTITPFMKTIMVFGTFDFLHLGHLDLFKQAKALGDKLIVVISRDSNVERIKGKAPFFTQGERQKLVAGLKPVDLAVLGHEDDFYTAIKQFKPDVIALGYDQTTLPEEAIKAKLKSLGLKTKIVRLKPFSHSKHKSSAVKNFYSV